MGEIGDARAAPALMAAVRDPDAWVRLDIVRALGRLKTAAAIDVLILELADENIDIRMEALHALGCTRDKRAAEPLVVALSDRHQEIRSGAAEALDQIGWIPPDRHDRALLLMAKKQWADLLAISGFPLESVWVGLSSREEYVREHAVETLGRTGDDRVAEFLLAGMGDPSRDVRLCALRAFIQLPSLDPTLPEALRVAARQC
jgi:HEAT repeat protein